MAQSTKYSSLCDTLDSTKAVSFFFSLYRLFPPLSLQWDSRNKQVFTHGRSHHTYKIWLINQLVVVGFLTTFSCSFTMFCNSEMNPVGVVFAALFLPVAAFDCGYSCVLFWFCEDIALGYTRMKQLLNKSIDSQNWKGSHRSWKVAGMVYRVFLVETLFISTFIPVILWAYHLDPVGSVLEYLFAHDVPHGGSVSISLTRLILMILFLAEASRIYASFVALIFHWLEMVSVYLELVRASSSRISNSEFWLHYVQLQLVIQTWEKPFAEWIKLMMGTFLVIIVFCNIIAMKFYTIISPMLILMVSTCTIVDILVVSIVLPQVTD